MCCFIQYIVLYASFCAPYIYGTVQNPFVITKYKGLDPEVANAADKTFGIDKNVYPRPLVGILGVSLNF